MFVLSIFTPSGVPGKHPFFFPTRSQDAALDIFQEPCLKNGHCIILVISYQFWLLLFTKKGYTELR